MQFSKYMNPAQLVVNTISDLHTNNLTTFPKAGLDKEGKAIVEKECNDLFNEIKDGNFDFVENALVSHIVILNNVIAACHRKSKSSPYFREFTELSLKATDQLCKSGVALARIKNIIVSVENLTLQQNNLLQLNTGQPQQESTQEVAYDEKMVTE